MLWTRVRLDLTQLLMAVSMLLIMHSQPSRGLNVLEKKLGFLLHPRDRHQQMRSTVSPLTKRF